jgi:hypothetical protein
MLAGGVDGVRAVGAAMTTVPVPTGGGGGSDEVRANSMSDRGITTVSVPRFMAPIPSIVGMAPGGATERKLALTVGVDVGAVGTAGASAIVSSALSVGGGGVISGEALTVSGSEGDEDDMMLSCVCCNCLRGFRVASVDGDR